MERLSKRIHAARVPQGSAELWWLGQAGFSFKTSGGTVVYVDPYLSDAVYRTDGFRRLSLSPIEADEVRADLVVLTHEHPDHLDPDAVPVISANNPDCIFVGPSGCTDGLVRAGVKGERIRILAPHEPVTFRDVTIHAAAADHGGFSTTAVSLCLDLRGPKVMMTGDTSWRSDLFTPLYGLGLDVLIACINGGFGNMSHLDAARMAGEAGARIAIPCHFWTFAEQGAGDPLGFITACQRFAPAVKALLLSPGEGLVVESQASRGHGSSHFGPS